MKKFNFLSSMWRRVSANAGGSGGRKYSERQSNDAVLTLDGASIEHSLSMYSACIGTTRKPAGWLRKVAAVFVLLFTIGAGCLWADQSSVTWSGGSYSSSTITWSTTNLCTIYQEQNGAQTAPNSSYVSAPRWYSGNKITITAGSSVATFTSIVITASNNTYGSTLANSTYTVTGGTGSISASNSSGTVTISMTGTVTAFTIVMGGQSRLNGTGVTVNYTAPAATTYNLYLMNCTGSYRGSYSSNKGTSGSGTGSYSGCTKYSGIAEGTSVTITAAPDDGFQFDGWTDGGYSIILDDGGEEITPSSTTSTTATISMPASDVVIWSCNFSEVVSCDKAVTISKGGSTNCSFTLSKTGSQASCDGVSTTVTVSPTSGYGSPSVTQSGASATPTITGSGNSWTVTYAANTTGTSTINVSCSANNYTITLDKDLTPTTAGTASITATYNANTNLTSAITKPTKTGWTFGGYYTAKNGGGTQIIDANGNVIASVSGYTDASRNWKYANNITLYAKWTCTVTWSVNTSTSVYSAQTVTYNASSCKVASVPTPSAASYCGDKFMGWSKKSAGTESKTTTYYDDLFSDVSGSPTITGNTTFYAVFADYAD